MSRYIDADALMKDFEKYIDDESPLFNKVANKIIKILKLAPSIDIVRCAECTYWNTDGCREGVGECTWAYYMTNPDDFCSYGEREGE